MAKNKAKFAKLLSPVDNDSVPIVNVFLGGIAV